MKRRIPSAGKVAKDAKECVQECVSEFISFITSEASDRCLQEKRKTINGEDLLTAMQSLGFDAYIEPLSIYIKQYREATRADKDTLPSGQSTTDTDEPTTTNAVGSVVLLDGADANVDSDAAYRLLQRHATATTIFVDSNGQHYISLPTDNGTINLMAVHIPTDVANAAAASSSNQPIN
jgi:nuclear transcription Y subunit beta